MLMKTKDDLKIGHIKKSFTENKIRLENYQEVFKYMAKLNKEIQRSIEIQLETWLKGTAITELLEELEMDKLNHSK